MNEKILAKYRELRQDHVGRYAGGGRVSHYRVKANQALRTARYHVRVAEQWEEAGDSVRLRWEPDYSFYIEDLKGDSYKPEVNPSINPSLLARQEKEFEELVQNEGVWTLVGEYRCPYCGDWKHAGSVGGFVGQDGCGYEVDIMSETLSMR